MTWHATRRGPEVTFNTGFFQPVPYEEEQTNAGVYGKQLADWISEQLNKNGMKVEEVVAEDFGWAVIVSRKPILLWIACSNVRESTEWRMYPVAEPYLRQRLFGFELTPRAERLRTLLQEIVPTIPGVSAIEWQGTEWSRNQR